MRVAYTRSYTVPVGMHGQSLLSGATGSSVDLPVMCHVSNGKAGSGVDTVDIGPVEGEDIPIVLHWCSDPTGISLEKLLAAGHFSELDWGHDKEYCRR